MLVKAILLGLVSLVAVVDSRLIGRRISEDLLF